MISKGKKSVALCAAVLTALSISCTVVDAAGDPAVPYFSVKSKDQMPNYDSQGAQGEKSVAIGPGSTSKFREGVTVGANNKNEGYFTTVIGSENKAYGLKPDVEHAYGATLVGTNNTVMSTSGVLAMGSKNIVYDGVAIGAGNKSMGQNAIALGNYSSAMYTDSIGIGFGTHSYADDVIAIGRAAEGSALGGVAIGTYAEVHASTGVALGYGSTSEREAGVVGYMPGAVGQTAEEVAAYLGKAEEYKSWKADVEANKDAYTRAKAWYDAVDAERQAYNEVNKARIAYAENSTEENKKAITEKYDAWKKADALRSQTDQDTKQDRDTIKDLNARYGQIFGKLMSTGGAVSVGNEKEGITRQIVNVAAGTKDTDAVNVYQLRDAVENFKQETRVAEDGKYVKKDKTAGENLTALDKEIDKLGTDSAVAEDGAYVKKDKKVGENLTALDKQVQANAGEIGALTNGMGELDSRVNKVGAGSAALAALHPLDFDPENKWNFAAGYGHYKGADAVAIGAFYRPDENKMVSIGGSFGGGEDMINAGVSIKVGEGNSPYAGVSKAQLAQRISQQDEIIQRQDAELAAQKAQIREILEQLAAMKKA
ncbi:MAG: YadA-like family protein [Negativicoccus succinicivorans]|nr:YadA-like family protein [Negativicoccus succinicivorans]